MEDLRDNAVRRRPSVAEKRERAAAIRWFHTLDLGDGVVTDGRKSAADLAHQAEAFFALPLEGRSVLDVGAWDGYFSIAAHRRGASRVLATDHYCWSGRGWGTRDGIELALAVLAPEIETLDIDVPRISRPAVGLFDVTLFAGVLYHLKSPFVGLERAAAVTRDVLIVETALAGDLSEQPPAMRFYPGAELNGDVTNWWAPNRSGVEAMLSACRFKRLAFDEAYARRRPGRGLFHAHRR